MEIFLLLLDELDDAVAVLGSLAYRIIGFLFALSLFGLTGFLLVQLPLPIMALLGICGVLLWFVAQARSRLTLALGSER